MPTVILEAMACGCAILATDVGANTAIAIADDVGTALRGVTISGVVFKASSVIPIGREDDEPFYQVNITTPFRYDLMA